MLVGENPWVGCAAGCATVAPLSISPVSSTIVFAVVVCSELPFNLFFAFVYSFPVLWMADLKNAAPDALVFFTLALRSLARSFSFDSC